MVEFSAGQIVKWGSQAGGSFKEKMGVVEVIVPAGMDPTKLTPELDNPGLARDHTSYLVRVPGKRSKGKLYWPRVLALTATTTTNKE